MGEQERIQMGRFDSSSIPMFSPHIAIKSEDVTTLVSPHATYVYRGKARDVVETLLPLIGRRSLKDLSHLTDLPVATISEALEPILSDDLVDVAPVIHSPTASAFMSAYFELCDEWARYIFAEPFWQTMFAGQASRQQVLGWGVEFYHRTLGADEHNKASVDHCTADSEVKEWLVEHFSEEFGHSDMFLHGLVACGFTADDVLNSKPLSSTRALIDYFTSLAETDTIGYLGCYGVLHSPRVGQTPSTVRSQFEQLSGYYPFASGVLNAIRDHALLDLDLEHDQIVLERLGAREAAFSANTGINILNAARGSVLAFVNYFQGIFTYYGSSDACLIRRGSAAWE
jgi:pyrroloquinoline quinone (PQQ) biosynthesis protein C